jgi:hypothetical protein
VGDVRRLLLLLLLLLLQVGQVPEALQLLLLELRTSLPQEHTYRAA